ncbi:hypothetical protein [Gordonia hankookensis]|uniref:Uncharacterized protein n=1 Tax=Gordonia hankookensis TaxID=589403 RepID=A0ABR7WL31_9ACTN|nr:hypothetical protein [Gordonia hankookensis]MBD1322499.1 hypothetical protein [Gordonia hankookensis]
MAVTPKNSVNPSGAPNVVWPDPSPLRDWWTSVMDSEQDEQGVQGMQDGQADSDDSDQNAGETA